jgi:hypothetical protein
VSTVLGENLGVNRVADAEGRGRRLVRGDGRRGRRAFTVVDEVDDAGTVVRLRARTTAVAGMCPRCGGASRRVHAWHVRRLTDLPVAGRSLVIELRLRRLICQVPACSQRTFRQQVPELALRYARHTLRLTTMIGRLAITLAGRAGAALLSGLGVAVSRSTMLRVLMALPIPSAPAPRVLSVDDVALMQGAPEAVQDRLGRARPSLRRPAHHPPWRRSITSSVPEPEIGQTHQREDHRTGNLLCSSSDTMRMVGSGAGWSGPTRECRDCGG